MKKTRWMWVHYGTEPVKAKVLWSRNGLAVTRVGRDAVVLTHVMTGNCIFPSRIVDFTVKDAISFARVIAPLYAWNDLSFHTIVVRSAAMKKRCEVALFKAGLVDNEGAR